RWKVTNEDCAKAQGSGDMDVLSTPRVAALMEQAACEALSRAGFLAPGQTTVGVRLDIRHQAPTTPGEPVQATARLLSKEGQRFLFSIEAEDKRGTIAQAEHIRQLVDRRTFMLKARRRAERG
ncbi:MAG: hypothetical protein OEZ59_05995, partial [Deltaproteobacteria bacterium]|nr:hypothetical protein [Deltaproteobacteria bacterium]